MRISQLLKNKDITPIRKMRISYLLTKVWILQLLKYGDIIPIKNEDATFFKNDDITPIKKMRISHLLKNQDITTIKK